MVCLYGPAVLSLDSEYQMILWHGRRRAKSHMQLIHWDTRGDMSKDNVVSTYTDLFGSERAMHVSSIMDRSAKEAEAKRRLDEP